METYPSDAAPTEAPRYRSSDPAGVETPWASLDALLDGLEGGQLDADDYVYDRTRQAWQRIQRHDGIVAAWDQRMGYRQPEHRRLISSARRQAAGFPSLMPDGMTPVAVPALDRADAHRRATRAPEDVPQVRRTIAALEVLFVLLVLGLLAVGLVLGLRGVEGLLE
jgi:hypothetical protein